MLPAATAATVGRGPLTVIVGLMVMEATIAKKKLTLDFNNGFLLLTDLHGADVSLEVATTVIG